jgi:hypothetical protein
MATAIDTKNIDKQQIEQWIIHTESLPKNWKH